MTAVKGVAPGFLLLPAREYERELPRKVEISLPLEGSISDILKKENLSSRVQIGGEDHFSIFDDKLLLLWELVRVMFAGAKYPQLEDNESLNVVALEFTDDEVTIYGEILQSVG